MTRRLSALPALTSLAAALACACGGSKEAAPVPLTVLVSGLGAGSGTVTSSPAGISCGSDCTESYPPGTVVTLTAWPAPGSGFDGWQECTSANGATCTVRMSESRTVVATFWGTQVLSVVRAGDGSGTVTSSPPGIDCGAACTHAYPLSSTVTLTATPAYGSSFAGWEWPDCIPATATSCTVRMPPYWGYEVTVRAVFDRAPLLTVVAAPAGSGTVVSFPAGIDCGADCTEPYAAGTVVTLTAIPAAGSAFRGWFGCPSPTDSTCTVTVSADIIVAAVFFPPPELRVALAGNGLGTVVSSPAGIDCGADCAERYPAGTVVTLTAIPAAGSTFGGWVGCPSPTESTCTVAVSADITVAAAFYVPAELRVARDGNGSGVVASSPNGIDCGTDCAETYPGGADVTLTAAAASGSLFMGWQGCTSTSGFTCVVRMTEPRAVTATFARAPSRLATRTVAAGLGHSFVIRPDGTLWAWGDNYTGALGDGTYLDLVAPVAVGSGYASVVAGPYHTAAIEPDGTLWTWGRNTEGALGDGTFENRLEPVLVGTGFVSVAAGTSHTVAVKGDGTLWAWGLNSSGQLGLGAGRGLWVPRPALVGTGFVTVAAGHVHTVAVKADGTLWAWGSNERGSVGDGSGALQPSPVLIGTGFAEAAAGTFDSVAIEPDGTLWVWGCNEHGQLGDGTLVDRSVPVPIGGGFAAVATGGNGWAGHTVATKTDGTLWAWGANSSGQLGDGTTVDRASPVQVGSGFASVALGFAHSTGVMLDGTVWTWGATYRGWFPRPPTEVASGVRSTAAAYSQTAAVKEDGSLWMWGAGDFGQIGDGASATRWLPVRIGDGFDRVALGQYHTIALKTDGTVWTWGNNGMGQIGDGTTATRPAPVQVGSGYAAVAAGGSHSLALGTDGSLWSWGWNACGQVGDGTTTDRATPFLVGSGFASIAAAHSFSAAVKADGTLWTWGALDPWGDPSGWWWDACPASPSPVELGGGFVSVVAGGRQMFAFASDGTLQAWGANESGQLGDGTTLGQGFTAVATGSAHTVALKADGTLWAWGGNAQGQLGDGGNANRTSPVQVGSGFAAAAAGGWLECGWDETGWSLICWSWGHTAAVKADGTLWVWGADAQGQVGGPELFFPVPVQVHLP